MKKFVMLMLVLGMASLATAGLQLSVNGSLDPVDSEITILPSTHLVLDIHGTTPQGQAVNWMVTVNSAAGTVSGGTAQQGGITGNFPQIYPDNYFLPSLGRDNTTHSATAGWVGDSGAALSGLLVDLIDFHCEAPGDAVIELYSSPDVGVWTLEDTAVIHQIPEPMTMVLLGLGGLLLRRRK